MQLSSINFEIVAIINARVFNKIAGKPCTFIFKNQYNNLSVFQQTLNTVGGKAGNSGLGIKRPKFVV